MSRVRRAVAPVAAGLFVLAVIFNTSFGASVDATPPTTRVRIGVQHILTTVPSGFPTPGNTGPRFTPTDGPFNDLVTTSDGQIISGDIITEQLTIRHDNVHVADSLILGETAYMIHVTTKVGGGCPTGVLIEYTEVDGASAAADDYAVRGGSDCGFTLDHSYVHNTGRGVIWEGDTVLTHNYITVDRDPVPGDHRNGIMTNGGSNAEIVHNTVLCDNGAAESGCSAGISNFGDFAQLDNILIQDNLIAATATYCIRGGEEPAETFGEPTNVRIIGNAFSNQFHAQCGSAGPIGSFEPGIRGNECGGNYFYETSDPVTVPTGCG